VAKASIQKAEFWLSAPWNRKACSSLGKKPCHSILEKKGITEEITLQVGRYAPKALFSDWKFELCWKKVQLDEERGLAALTLETPTETVNGRGGGGGLEGGEGRGTLARL
jgi:hypothetical protein